jgi:hypothetical protein
MFSTDLIMEQIEQHRRETSVRAALKFSFKLAFAGKLIHLLVKNQAEI